MDIVHAIWLSSTFGAAMFFSAGMLFGGRLRRADGSTLSETRLELDRSISERAALQAELARLGTALADTKSALDEEHARAHVRTDELREALSRQADAEGLRHQERTLRQQHTELSEKLAQSEAEATRLRSQLEAASSREAKHKEELRARDAWSRQNGELSEKLARSEAEALHLRSQLQAASTREAAQKEQLRARDALTQQNAELSKTLARSEAEALRLRSQLKTASTHEAERNAFVAKLEDERTAMADTIARLETQLVAARKDARAEVEALRLELAAARALPPETDADLSTLQRRSAELSLKAQRLEQRALEFDRQAEENHALKSQLENVQTLRAENEALVRRVRELEALSFATASSPVDAHAPIAEPAKAGLEGVQQVLDTLRQEIEGCKIIALSDMRGLLIAAAGEHLHQDELAAAASATTYAVERIRDLLPMSAPRFFEWMDDNHVALRTQWLRSTDDSFLLTTLRVDATSSAPHVDSAGSVLCRLLVPSPENVDDGHG